MIGFYRPKIDQKWTNLNRYISNCTNTDKKRFVVFENTINQLSLIVFICLDLDTIFLVFSFCFLPLQSTLKMLNAQYSDFKDQRNWIFIVFRKILKTANDKILKTPF